MLCIEVAYLKKKKKKALPLPLAIVYTFACAKEMDWSR